MAKRSLLSSLGAIDLEADFHTIQSKFKDEIKAATVDVREGLSPKYWWNKDLDVLFRRKTTAWKKDLRFPSSANCEEACKLN